MHSQSPTCSPLPSLQVAFNYVIVQYVPKISYSTYIDQYFTISYFFIGLSTVEHIVVFLMDKNRASKGAVIVDWVFIACYLVVYSVYSLWFVVMGKCCVCLSMPEDSLCPVKQGIARDINPSTSSRATRRLPLGLSPSSCLASSRRLPTILSVCLEEMQLLYLALIL